MTPKKTLFTAPPTLATYVAGTILALAVGGIAALGSIIANVHQPQTKQIQTGDLSDWSHCGSGVAVIKGRPSDRTLELSRAITHGWQPFQYVEYYGELILVRYPDTPCQPTESTQPTNKAGRQKQ